MQIYLSEMQSVLMSGMGPASYDIKSAINRDGSADAQLAISDFEEAMDWRDVLEVLSKFFSSGVVPLVNPGGGPSYWISIGLRFGPQEPEELEELADLYKRYRGMFQVSANYQRMDDNQTIQTNIAASLQVGNSLIEKRGLEPTVILVRIAWSLMNTQPKRYEGERGSNPDKKRRG